MLKSFFQELISYASDVALGLSDARIYLEEIERSRALYL